MEEVILSVLIPTYNQEAYIEKALDSVLEQKTQYKYEVLVGEDVSTDNTRNVLKKYEKEHPGKITVFYRENNLGRAVGVLDNHMDLYNKAQGKYVIFLEGDDYWVDDNKIEEQVSFLERHADYVAVAHNCKVVDRLGHDRGISYPECKDEEYTVKHYEKNILPGQLATLMMRNIYKLPNFRTDMWEKRLVPGDRIFCFSLLSYGKIYCIQRIMTAYRYVIDGGSSYSANVKYDFAYDEFWHKELYTFALSTHNNVLSKCAGTLYMKCLVTGLRTGQLSIQDVVNYIRNIESIPIVLVNYIYIFFPIYLRKVVYKIFAIDSKKM